MVWVFFSWGTLPPSIGAVKFRGSGAQLSHQLGSPIRGDAEGGMSHMSQLAGGFKFKKTPTNSFTDNIAMENEWTWPIYLDDLLYLFNMLKETTFRSYS